MNDLDLRSLLRPGTRGDAIPLFGVYPGASAADLRAVPWSSAEEDLRSEPRHFRDGKVFLVFPSGREEEIPLAVSIERAIVGTGWLRLEQPQIRARIENGVLARLP